MRGQGKHSIRQTRATEWEEGSCVYVFAGGSGGSRILWASGVSRTLLSVVFAAQGCSSKKASGARYIYIYIYIYILGGDWIANENGASK